MSYFKFKNLPNEIFKHSSNYKLKFNMIDLTELLIRD